MTAADDAVRVSRRVVLAAGAGAALASCGMRGSGVGRAQRLVHHLARPARHRRQAGMPPALPQPELRRASGTTWSTSLHATGGQADVGGRNLAVMTYEGSGAGADHQGGPWDDARITLRNDLEPSSGGGMGMGGMGVMGRPPTCTRMACTSRRMGIPTTCSSLSIRGAEQRYRFAIPTNQWGGLNWYHPHHHGTVSAQVLGGMSGRSSSPVRSIRCRRSPPRPRRCLCCSGCSRMPGWSPRWRRCTTTPSCRRMGIRLSRSMGWSGRRSRCARPVCSDGGSCRRIDRLRRPGAGGRRR